jgi:hypothetical protein
MHLHTLSQEVDPYLIGHLFGCRKYISRHSYQRLLPFNQLEDPIINPRSSTDERLSYHDSCCRLNPRAIAGLTERMGTSAATRTATHSTIDPSFMFMASTFRPVTCYDSSRA